MERLTELERRLASAQHLRNLKLLRDPNFRALAQAMGLDLGPLDAMRDELDVAKLNLMRAIALFARFGWAITGNQIDSVAIAAAVAAWDDGRGESAVDGILADAWTEPDLKRAYHQILGYVDDSVPDDDPTLELLLMRLRVLDRAVEHHLAGQYEASTLIALTQIDGITYDVTGGHQGFFLDADHEDFHDDVSIAGMPEVLASVRAAVNKPSRRPVMGIGFRRHAIVHGRDPAFGTKVNSAKAFALLSAIVDWARARGWPAWTRTEGRKA